ncbi:hypothetical protein CPter91_0236 [Collimonas pratensis]|uniref:Uncharacterized protein n=1 Tax=Collimonas pratensis TaxID=279113 RepID=A0A127PYG0_9BURK|nr:hypothetical protein CPter91_0236 [Collimonas pratensis]
MRTHAIASREKPLSANLWFEYKDENLSLNSAAENGAKKARAAAISPSE